MSKTEPAFPQGKSVGSVSVLQGGMTLRDYFAAKAMQSLVLATQTMTHVTPEDVVGEAYHYADRMLEARELL